MSQPMSTAIAVQQWPRFPKQAWHNLSLARKLQFVGATAIFVVAFVLTFVTYISAEDSLRTQMRRQVHNELKVFERLYQIRNGSVSEPLQAEVAGAACNEMVDLMGGFSAIFQGHEPLAVAGLGASTSRLSLPPDLLASSDTDRFTRVTLHQTTYLVAVHPLRDAQGILRGSFVRGIPQKQISDMLQKHAWGIFSMAGTAMMLALVVLVWLTQEIASPLTRLARASRNLVDGESLDTLTVTHGKDELGSLATDFMALADRLSAQKAALEEKDRLRGQLLEKLISAQEDERRRISRELHDQTGQSLTSLLVGLKVLEKAKTLDDMRERTAGLMQLVHQTLEEVHRLSVELRPQLLDDLGLIPAIRAQAKEFEASHGIKVEVRIQGLEGRLPPLVESSLYRVVQEALTNIGKYAAAHHVAITLQRQENQLMASIMDDGVGFDKEAILQGRNRENLGILGMQERVGLLGGYFSLDSTPNGGTCVSFLLPLEQVSNSPAAS